MLDESYKKKRGNSRPFFCWTQKWLSMAYDRTEFCKPLDAISCGYHNFGNCGNCGQPELGDGVSVTGGGASGSVITGKI